MVLRWGTRFIVQSEDEQERLLALIPGAQMVVVPHPIYDMFADQRLPKDEARRRLGLPLNVPVLLFFGIVREYKGLKDILAALPEVRARLGKVVLLVAGEFWEDKQPYLETVKRLGIDDSVIIEDRYIPNEEVPLYFSAADLLLAPYRSKTDSGVIRMAQGFKVPFITVSSGETQVENIVSVSVGNANGLVQAIIGHFAGGCGNACYKVPSQERASAWEQLAAHIICV